MPDETPATARRKEMGWVAFALAALAAVALRPSIRGNDGVGNYVYASSLLLEGDLDFSDDYLAFDREKDYAFRFSELPRSPVTGRPSNRYGVGSAMLWGPFVATAHRYASQAAKIVRGTERHYEWGVGIGSAWWGSLGLWLLYWRIRKDLSPIAAVASVAGLILASPLGFYVYAHGSMSHANGFFAAVCLMLAGEGAWRRPSIKAMALCGAFGALIAMIRFQDAVWAIIVCGAAAARAVQTERVKAALPVGAIVAAGIVAFLPQMAAWNVLYGSPFSGPLPYLDSSAGSFSAWPANLLQALFSSRHGALAWHPLVLIGLIGLGYSARQGCEGRYTAMIGWTGFAATAWLVGCWSMWWAGASFGNRFFIGALPWIGIGVAAAFDRAARTRGGKYAAICVLILLIAWNTGLLLQYGTEMIPREEGPGWGRIVKQNLIDVPLQIVRRVK